MMRLNSELYARHAILFEEFGTGANRKVMGKAFNPMVAPQYLRYTAIAKTKEEAFERLKKKIDKR